MKIARCPTCKRVAKQVANKAFPFCCERCQLIDLGRWLNEEYRIPEEIDAHGGSNDGMPPTGDDDR